MASLANVRQLVAALLAALAGPAMADWVLEHDERFAGAAGPDRGWWSVESGLFRNREAQAYTDRNVVVRDGVLRLEARREKVPNPQHQPGAKDWRLSRRESAYSSGSIVSQRPLHFARVEVVARAPSGAGLWPAIWLVHESAGAYGEIDVFEAVGKHPDTVFAGVHWGREARTRRHRNASRPVPGFEGGWHTHTLEWTPAGITVALDGQPWFRFDPEEARLPGGLDPLRLPMRLRLNLALGGNWGGTVDAGRLPAAFEIRSVRVWRWAPGAAKAAPPVADAPAAPPPAVVPGAVQERTAPPVRWGR